MDTVQPVLTPVAGMMDLSVNRDKDDVLLVFFGLALVERLPREDVMGRKLLAARLYNLGIARQRLEEVFEVSRTTLHRWGQALQSGDPERLRKALSGQGAVCKVTAPIEQFVRFRYRQLCGVVKAHSEVIAAEVMTIFGVSLCASRLRWIFRRVREEAGEVQIVGEDMDEAAGAVAAESAVAFEGVVSSAAVSVGSLVAPAAEVVDEPLPGTNSGAFATVPRVLLPSSRHISLHPACLPPPGEQRLFCHHAGLFLLLPQVEQWLGGWPEEAERLLLRQWALQILAGAVNHEQSKLLSGASLEVVSGPVIRSLDQQRRQADAMATAENLRRLATLNVHYLKAGMHRCFYYDPHAKQYSGMHQVLKGWCGAIHTIRKVLYLDAIHTPAGAPCFFLPADNYDDARERFFTVRERFRACLGAPSTERHIWIFDRGFYGLDHLRRLLATDDGFITWEKGYTHDGWQETAETHTFDRCRSRNRQADLRLYRFCYQSGTWDKEPTVRRLIVRATGPDRPAIEVSILLGRCDQDDPQSIWLLFNRWLQENDFGYLIRHFGLHELTSRAIDTYDTLAPLLADRQVESRQHRQGARERQQIEKDLGRLLVRRDRAGRLSTTLSRLQEEKRLLNQQSDQLITQLSELREQMIATDQPGGQPLCTLLDAAANFTRQSELHEKRHQRYLQQSKLQEQLDACRSELTAVEQRLADIPGQESRLQALIDDGYVRLNTVRKTLMDAIRLAARNIFYESLQPFRQRYDNYRDDHALFRTLTRSPGFIHRQGANLTIELLPNMDLSPKLRTILLEVLAIYAKALTDLYRQAGHPMRITLLLADTKRTPGMPERSPTSSAFK